MTTHQWKTHPKNISLEKEWDNQDIAVNERLTVPSIPKSLNGNIILFGVEVIDNIKGYLLNTAFIKSFEKKQYFFLYRLRINVSHCFTILSSSNLSMSSAAFSENS